MTPAMPDIAPDLVNPHEPGPECGDTHCYWHNVDEPAEGAYRVCGECGHVYRTAEALRAAFMDELAPDLGDLPGMPPLADEILGCPMCLHDW